MKTKINYEEFEKYIIAMRNNYDFEIKLMILATEYGADLGICSTPSCSSELCRLLQICMDDKDEWIDYFCYELNFGRNWEKGMITAKDGSDIKLQTIEDLYKLLTNNIN